MKIRIKGNMVRFRLSKTDVDLLTQNGFLTEQTEFGPGNVLEYSVRADSTVQRLAVTFKNNAIILLVPEQDLKKWSQTELVGLQEVSETGDGKNLHLLLEKDFKCLDQVAEDQSDNYPNPLMKMH